MATRPNSPNAKSENAMVTMPRTLSSGARRTARSTSRRASFMAPSAEVRLTHGGRFGRCLRLPGARGGHLLGASGRSPLRD